MTLGPVFVLLDLPILHVPFSEEANLALPASAKMKLKDR